MRGGAIANALTGLAANLSAGVRMALFLPISENALRVAPRNLLALILAVVLARVAGALLLSGSVWDELHGVLFPVALAVMVAAALAEAHGKPQMLATLLVALLAVGLSIECALWAFADLRERVALPAWADKIPLLALVWLALAAANSMAQLLSTMGLRLAAVYASSLLLCVALPLANIHDGVLWPLTRAAADETAYPTDEYDPTSITEETFYRQPKLLEQALAGLRRENPRQTELFFVGLAGDAAQDVFLREVHAVAKMMAERFGAAGHTISLINSYNAPAEYPLASVTGLRQTLQRIGDVMDKRNDILFLFLTSHGDDDHSVVLEFWPISLDPLKPEVLRQLLDESGIQWRVVVVSACYSGGFIEPLRDAKTIVITASAPDRTSFGCDDENEWTYFGKAFFDEALRQESDLPAAFEIARQAIARREREENVDPASNPMIASGSAMERRWRAFLRERGLRAPQSASGEIVQTLQ